MTKDLTKPDSSFTIPPMLTAQGGKMDRLPISSAVPAEIAERLSDRGVEEYSAEDLKEARTEMKESLLSGDRVSGFDLKTLLDCELNRNYSMTVRTLYELLAGIGTDPDQYLRCLKIDEWLELIVNKHLDQSADKIEERAAELAAERLEDA